MADYKGKAIIIFRVGNKKGKNTQLYKKGDIFKTTHKKSLDYLVKTGRVELITKK